VTPNNKLQISTNANKTVIESSNTKNNNNIDIASTSLNIENENNLKDNKRNQIANSFNDVISSNVQNFSFIGVSSITNKNNSNVISTNTNLNLTSSNNNINNNNSNNSTINNNNSNKQYSSVSPQTTNKNESNNNNNKFNIPNNNSNMNNSNNYNQPQNIQNINVNTNQDIYNAYQMQMSALLAQNMTPGLGQQQVYPMPLLYYPPNTGANTADPCLNYSNFMPYMGYPMGYYVQPQMAQQQGSLKDGNDLQNKNRKMNNYVNNYFNVLFFCSNLFNEYFLFEFLKT